MESWLAHSFSQNGPTAAKSMPVPSAIGWKLGGAGRTTECPSSFNSCPSARNGITSPVEPTLFSTIRISISLYPEHGQAPHGDPMWFLKQNWDASGLVRLSHHCYMPARLPGLLVPWSCE